MAETSQVRQSLGKPGILAALSAALLFGAAAKCAISLSPSAPSSEIFKK